jgi:hypothetical protein
VEFALIWWLTQKAGSATLLAIASLTGMFIVGVTNPIANGPLMSIVQSMVNPEMEGCVMGLINTFATGIYSHQPAVGRTDFGRDRNPYLVLGSGHYHSADGL